MLPERRRRAAARRRVRPDDDHAHDCKGSHEKHFEGIAREDEGVAQALEIGVGEAARRGAAGVAGRRGERGRGDGREDVKEHRRHAEAHLHRRSVLSTGDSVRIRKL